jgi:hypothetical protein
MDKSVRKIVLLGECDIDYDRKDLVKWNVKNCEELKSMPEDEFDLWYAEPSKDHTIIVREGIYTDYTIYIYPNNYSLELICNWSVLNVSGKNAVDALDTCVAYLNATNVNIHYHV